jgi:hypothetical protein
MARKALEDVREGAGAAEAGGIGTSMKATLGWRQLIRRMSKRIVRVYFLLEIQWDNPRPSRKSAARVWVSSRPGISSERRRGNTASLLRIVRVSRRRTLSKTFFNLIQPLQFQPELFDHQRDHPYRFMMSVANFTQY